MKNNQRERVQNRKESPYLHTRSIIITKEEEKQIMQIAESFIKSSPNEEQLRTQFEEFKKS